MAAPATFEELQDAFARRMEGRAVSDLDSGTIIVIPSISFASVELRKITGIEYYDERLLCLVLLLRRDDLRMVFVTSMPVADELVDYYLSFLPDPAGARRRLDLVTVADPEPSGLAEKILRNRATLDEIRRLAAGREDAFVLPFVVTEWERRLGEALGLPVFGPRPEHISLGTKSGGRELARRAGVPVLSGAENLRSIAEVERALFNLRAQRPDAVAAVIKLNSGFSGQGNAIMQFDDLTAPLEESLTTFCAAEESWATFAPKIVEDGAIVEILVRSGLIASPSVQLRIAPAGECEILSTHDQILGGPDDQVYLGCRFPAHPDYRKLIQEHALKIGHELGRVGTMGPFGVDFVVMAEGDGVSAYLSEINLRMGGTTHPFLMARGVTGATYDQSSGELIADGIPIRYVATDNLKSESFRGLSPRLVIDELRRRKLGFDVGRLEGTTVHLLGALSDYGKLGATTIGRTIDEAGRLHDEFVVALEDLARAPR